MQGFKSSVRGPLLRPGDAGYDAARKIYNGMIDHETQAFGLASTGGIASTTGIAGLTLGGSLGYLNRKYGLAAIT